MKKSSVNGIKIYAPESRDELIEYALSCNKILIALNAEKILNCNKDIVKIANNGIGYPDGIGAVLALKRQGFSNTIKIPGCELWLNIIDKTYKDKSFYLIGGTQDTIAKTIDELQREFNEINIIGSRNGYFKTDQEIEDTIKDISIKKPDVVFVAMGSPRQEQIMVRMEKVHPAIYQGLGGSFDVYIGNLKRAPDWFVKYGLEWFYRLLQEPKRIVRQLRLIRLVPKLLFGKFD
ncbi:glycosyl transferase [Vibrio breoganii]|uniref:WecB/TagA/CpsF family glycosyltransferase n=1 Tax=Vibrio breoganii TaxID=553239 RepID=UPI000C8492FD|nr:WecB/TagA/CpsF family glycosyltransferase [Vibrio breoganii]PMM04016.1 glycosyl transferase [Vibrio breoganii]